MALVKVQPIDRDQWHGKKGKENFSRPKVVEALYDDNLGRYATGLTEEEAAKYGKLMGVDLSDTFNPNEAHPYWSTKAASIPLPNHTIIFNTDRASDYVKVKNCKASKFVANSLKEYEEGKWPFATHVIYDESEEVSIKASKVQLKKKVVLMAAKMTEDDKRAIIMVVRNKNLKGRSSDYIDVEIDDILESPEDMNSFLKYVNMGQEEVYLRAQVLELIQKNILTKDGPAINYLGDTLGYDYEAAIEWFKDPINQRQKVAILEKLNK